MVFLKYFDNLANGRTIFGVEFPTLTQEVAQVFGYRFGKTQFVTHFDVLYDLAVGDTVIRKTSEAEIERKREVGQPTNSGLIEHQ